ncbi:MAG: hypothetical protein R3E42_06400 [Burkholderiaceae bacterium]
MADIGGGALYDIGCYAILSGRYVFGCEPARAVVLVDRDPAMGTDRTSSALLDFGQGRQQSFTVSTQSCPYQRVQIVGTTGRIEIAIPLMRRWVNAHGSCLTKVGRLTAARWLKSGSPKRISTSWKPRLFHARCVAPRRPMPAALTTPLLRPA